MIEIISMKEIDFEDVPVWACWLEIHNGETSWMLPATAPGSLGKSELQAHFDAQEQSLWQIAQAKQYPTDLYEYVPPKRVLKALALVIMDEINILRQAAGLAERTPGQVRAALKSKLRDD